MRQISMRRAAPWCNWCERHIGASNLSLQLGGVSMWEDDHGEEISRCNSAAELTHWCAQPSSARLNFPSRLDAHYPTRRAALAVTDDALVLAQQMLRTDPSQRPSAQQCLQSAYLRGPSIKPTTCDKENLGTTQTAKLCSQQLTKNSGN